MDKLDKAIKGFSCCKSRLFRKECFECPYEKDCYHDGIPTLLIFDALELLKEQQTEIERLKAEKRCCKDCEYFGNCHADDDMQDEFL